MGIAEALKKTENRIHNAALKAGRDPDLVKLVAVSKTVKLDRILEAVKAGTSIFGENKVQEARDKIKQSTEHRAQTTDHGLRVTDYDEIEWHLIGNLQKNKAKTAVALFDLIHSVDSIELARLLNKYAGQTDKNQRVLMQVKLSEEQSKQGAGEADLIKLLEQITKMEHLKLEGLMTMPPYFDDPEKTRPYFRKLREIRDSAEEKGYNLPELSMGMSYDFEVAVEEGSTMVRVGTAIFGERNY